MMSRIIASQGSGLDPLAAYFVVCGFLYSGASIARTNTTTTRNESAGIQLESPPRPRDVATGMCSSETSKPSASREPA